jgi:cytidine deaminase
MSTDELMNRARELVPNCHCPYSRFRVTAVLEDETGKLHGGVNVENASLGLSVCAERTALAAAVASGAKSFRRVLIYSPDGFPIPCGACRQVLREFCGDDFEVLVSGAGGEPTRFLLGSLLPCGFSLE